MGTFRISILCFFAVLPFFRLASQNLPWQYALVQQDVRLSGAYPDMAIAQNGSVHISYWNRDTDQLMYAFRPFGTTNWTREVVDAAHANGYKSSIALTATGQARIAYFENQGGNMQLRYAIRTGSNAWTVEQIPGDPNIGWGQYGPSAPANFTERIQASLDLVIKANGEPQILFFDNWMAANAFPFCDEFSNYGWQLHQAFKVAGTWRTANTLGLVADKYGNCDGDTLPKGDRYGEYVSFLQRKDGSLAAAAMSRWNNEVLLLQTTPGVDTAWNARTIDSLDRVRPAYNWAREWFTMEGISLYESPDSALHFSYGTSLFYGENFCCTGSGPTPWVTTMVYGKIAPNGTISYRGFGNTDYRNYTSIAGKGLDTTFLVYADLGSGMVMMFDTISGVGSSLNPIYAGTPISKNPLALSGDSLFVTIYDDSKERLVLCKRHVNGGNWVYEYVNSSELLGLSLDWIVEKGALDTTFSAVYNDGYNGDLYHSQGVRNGLSWNINTTRLDPNTSDFNAISHRRTAGGNLAVLYAAGKDQRLRWGIENGGSWSYETLDTTSFVTYTQLAISDLDTVHIAWFDGQAGCLYYGKRHAAGSAWALDTLPCDSGRAGEYASMDLDGNGNPHLAYYDEYDFSLQYAHIVPGAGWQVDTVYKALPSPVGKFASLEVASNGQPMIAFLDEQRTEILLAERASNGTWALSALDSTAVFSLGRPIELELDEYDNPWVAYNSFSNYDRVKLMHRDSIWRVVSVGTQGRIANAFRFTIVENDLYLLGKQHEPNNTGIGMLWADNGLYIAIDEEKVEEIPGNLTAWPNPVSDKLSIQLEVASPTLTHLALFDIMGHPVRKIWSGRMLPLGTYLTDISLTDLPNGVYFLQLSGENIRKAIRIIVNH